MSTNDEKLVKIGLVLAEIFGWICRFLPYRPKRCSCYPRNLCGYWTDFDQSCIRCSYNTTIEYLQIGTAIFLPVSERHPAE